MEKEKPTLTSLLSSFYPEDSVETDAQEGARNLVGLIELLLQIERETGSGGNHVGIRSEY